jgi:hypothetical protein
MRTSASADGHDLIAGTAISNCRNDGFASTMAAQIRGAGALIFNDNSRFDPIH